MTKTELHELVDALPDESLSAAAILLRRAQDPMIAKLDAAPYDDEELSEEDLEGHSAGEERARRLVVGGCRGAARWLSRADGGSRSALPP